MKIKGKLDLKKAERIINGGQEATFMNKCVDLKKKKQVLEQTRCLAVKTTQLFIFL